MPIFINEQFAQELKNKLKHPSNDKYSEIRRELAHKADKYMECRLFSITDYKGKSSNGSPNDYYSEAPYWWPDSENSSGPYIRRDGEYNPDRFNEHRNAMENMCEAVLYLSSAGFYLDEPHYIEKAGKLITAWFLDERTKMNPHLEYAQAIPGVCDGRGIGIIDTIMLIKVIHCADLMALSESGFSEIKGLRQWFSEYLTWMNTSEKGLDEKHYFNNHMSWWTVQAAAYSAFTGNIDLLNECFDMYKKDVLNQMNNDGAFADELTRTRSFTYALFNLQACTLLCEMAHLNDVCLWNYETAEGKGIKKAIQFMAPYLDNPFLWPYEQISGEPVYDDISFQLGALRLGMPELEKINENRRKDCRWIKNDSMLGAIALLPNLSENLVYKENH